MTNELKPCPFCGGEATTLEPAFPDAYTRMDIAYSASCKVCSIETIKTSSTEKATLLWNTRQPAFDWKPIEELTENLLSETWHALLYDENTGICDLPNIWIIGKRVFASKDIYENKISILDIKKKYTHYAILTPPQTNKNGD